jgi:RNA polymerase sigma factor (sigma-70 family)
LNLARDLLRRRGRRPEAILDETALPVVDTTHREDQRVRAALHELPRDQRLVIELHWFDELSFDEIAAVVGASSGAARARAHRGYERLRKSLDGARVTSVRA